ncbi:MAG: TATA-box-binding protein [Candidatus Aenigmatarchaeota archaeon]
MEFSNPDFEQNNAVFLENFDTDILLESLVLHLGLENVEYEPEQFPGVIYRPPEIGTVNLIFSSGKTIISGTIEEEVAKQSSEHLRKHLSNLST